MPAKAADDVASAVSESAHDGSVADVTVVVVFVVLFHVVHTDAEVSAPVVFDLVDLFDLPFVNFTVIAFVFASVAVCARAFLNVQLLASKSVWMAVWLFASVQSTYL